MNIFTLDILLFISRKLEKDTLIKQIINTYQKYTTWSYRASGKTSLIFNNSVSSSKVMRSTLFLEAYVR